MRNPDTVDKENMIKFYTDMLRSGECQCGRYKQPKRALCYRCWKQLPVELQRPLYSRIRNGFEKAYEDAVKWLTS